MSNMSNAPESETVMNFRPSSEAIPAAAIDAALTAFANCAAPSSPDGDRMKMRAAITATASQASASEAIPAENDAEDTDAPAWALIAEHAASEAYASHMGDPDGLEDYKAARNAAALAIEAHAKAALLTAPAPQAPVSDREGNVRRLVIAAREAFDSGTLGYDEQRALDAALESFSACVPYTDELEDRDAES